MSAPVTALDEAVEGLRKQRLRIVQIGRRALAIDEDDWRALLERVTGQRSARACNHLQLLSVMTELERLGWVPEAHGGVPWRPKAKHPHQRKVYALWGELKRRGIWRVSSVDSLRAFLRRTCGVDAPEFLNPVQATKAIEALKDIGARAGATLE